MRRELYIKIAPTAAYLELGFAKVNRQDWRQRKRFQRGQESAKEGAGCSTLGIGVEEINKRDSNEQQLWWLARTVWVSRELGACLMQHSSSLPLLEGQLRSL